MHWSQTRKWHFHLLCPLRKAQLKSTTPFYSEACGLQGIQTMFQAQMPQEKGKDPWVMLFLTPVSLPCHHFHATSTENGSFGTASVEKI